MLDEIDLMTVRAALWFWQEECAVQAPRTQRPYFDRSDIEPPGDDEVGRLRERLRECTLHAIDRRDALALLRQRPHGGAGESGGPEGFSGSAAVLLLSPEPDKPGPDD